ncbi:uncharacterized protein J3R85_020358 [Psidium guajava]|nr:uncharacterized protein J3R85_020358 [Psidium guajava]
MSADKKTSSRGTNPNNQALIPISKRPMAKKKNKKKNDGANRCKPKP